MKGISKKELKLVSNLEYDETYYFTINDIDKFVKNISQRYDMIKSLVKKKRIIKLNKTKYYLIPIKAKTGTWADHPFIVADEVCNGTDYFIGGWAAASYWKLTDQIPFQTDIYTTKRQGKINVLSTRIVFHRTTKKKINDSVIRDVLGHKFNILSRQEAKKWMKQRQ